MRQLAGFTPQATQAPQAPQNLAPQAQEGQQLSLPDLPAPARPSYPRFATVALDDDGNVTLLVRADANEDGSEGPAAGISMLPADFLHLVASALGALPVSTRNHLKDDGSTTRSDATLLSPAEVFIGQAMSAINGNGYGASVALTQAFGLLAQAKSCIADHLEGIA